MQQLLITRKESINEAYRKCITVKSENNYANTKSVTGKYENSEKVGFGAQGAWL